MMYMSIVRICVKPQATVKFNNKEYDFKQVECYLLPLSISNKKYYTSNAHGNRVEYSSLLEMLKHKHFENKF